ARTTVRPPAAPISRGERGSDGTTTHATITILQERGRVPVPGAVRPHRRRGTAPVAPAGAAPAPVQLSAQGPGVASVVLEGVLPAEPVDLRIGDDPQVDPGLVVPLDHRKRQALDHHRLLGADRELLAGVVAL